MGRHSKSRKPKTKKRDKKNRGSDVSPKPMPPSSTSLYAVLEIPVDADFETIRQQYVNLIRIHTPEADPEAFQAIRAAYDVLKDPESRRQYDRERFYGSSLSKLNVQVSKLLNNGRGQEAMRLLHQIVDIKPSADSYMMMAQIYVDYDQHKKAEESYLKAMALEDTEEGKVGLEIRWCHLSVGDTGSDYDIIEALLLMAQKYPKLGPRLIAREIFIHYLNLGQFKQGMAYFRKLIPRKKYLTASDFLIYMDWLDMLNEEDYEFELDQLLDSKVKPAAKKAAEGPHRDEIKTMLLRHANVDTSDWRFKAIIANLAYLADPTDKTVRKLWQDSVDKHLLQVQLADLITDLRIPTTIVHQILAGFHDKHHIEPGEAYMESLKTRPEIDQTLSEAEAIEFIAETYPRVYRTFKSRLLSSSPA